LEIKRAEKGWAEERRESAVMLRKEVRGGSQLRREKRNIDVLVQRRQGEAGNQIYYSSIGEDGNLKQGQEKNCIPHMLRRRKHTQLVLRGRRGVTLNNKTVTKRSALSSERKKKTRRHPTESRGRVKSGKGETKIKRTREGLGRKTLS